MGHLTYSDQLGLDTPNAYGDGLAARSGRRARTERLYALVATAESEAARSVLLDEVIRLNLTVAREIASRYHGRGIADEDIDQVASLGLVMAAQRFDPARGHHFLSFAVPTIRGEIRRHFRDLGWAIRPPRSVQELQARIGTAQEELHQELGRSPRPSEIAAHLGVELDLVRDSLTANGCFAPTSLDTSPDEDGTGLAGRLGGNDPALAGVETRAALKAVLTDLTPRERRILQLRFFGDLTQAEIGAEIGITQVQVSRLLNRLLCRLRRRLEEDTNPQTGDLPTDRHNLVARAA